MIGVSKLRHSPVPRRVYLHESRTFLLKLAEAITSYECKILQRKLDDTTEHNKRFGITIKMFIHLRIYINRAYFVIEQLAKNVRL